MGQPLKFKELLKIIDNASQETIDNWKRGKKQKRKLEEWRQFFEIEKIEGRNLYVIKKIYNKKRS